MPQVTLLLGVSYVPMVFMTMNGKNSITPFLRENLWISFLIILMLLFLTFYQRILLKKVRNRKKVYQGIFANQGPLSSQNFLNTLLYHLPDSVYIKDRDSRFLIASQNLITKLGKKSLQDIIGKTDHDFYPKEIADAYRKTETEIIATGKSITLEEENFDGKGNRIIMNTCKIPVKNSDGEIVGIVGIGHDITLIKEKENELTKKTSDLNQANSLLEEKHREILQKQEIIQFQSDKVNEDKKLLLTLINSMPDMIYIKDPYGKFIMGNNHVAEIMKAKSPDDLIGKTDFDFYTEEIASAYYQDEQNIMVQDIQLINKEEIGFNSAGEEIILSTTKVPVKDENGTIIGIVGIGRDITNQKEVEKALKEKSDALQEANVLLEERQEEIQQQSEELITQSEALMRTNLELEKLSLVASQTDNVIIIMDEKGNFEWINDGFVKRYKQNLEEFINTKGRNILDNSSYPDIENILEKIYQTKNTVNYTAQTKINESEVIWSRTTISPAKDENGNITQLIAIDTEITEIKEAEKQISEQHDELRQLNATKDKFFSIIAHDLKNPFHSIMGFSELLARNFDNIEDEKKKEFIKLINDSSTSAYSLLENLLNWARTQTNRINYNPSRIDLAVIVKEVFHMMSVHAENKNINLEYPDQFSSVFAFADYNMIYTVIRNLVSNALKFSKSGGKVTISLQNIENRIEVSISDTGIGMTNEEKNKLFRLDEFNTTAGTAGETGTGLGLIVCREFIIRHGGDIKIESEKGKGSTFSFSLPVDTELQTTR